MLSGPSFMSAFVFSINSLIFSGFPLTFFHLAEASLSAFSWLYTLVCAVVQKYHEMSFIYNYSHFSTHFESNLFYLHNLKMQTNYGTTIAPYMRKNEIKTKTNQVTSHSNWSLVLLLYLVHKQSNDFIKG